MARIQNALSSVTERFQGFEQFRAVWPPPFFVGNRH